MVPSCFLSYLFNNRKKLPSTIFQVQVNDSGLPFSGTAGSLVIDIRASTGKEMNDDPDVKEIIPTIDEIIFFFFFCKLVCYSVFFFGGGGDKRLLCRKRQYYFN